jgi:hypothetical protein
MKTLTAAAVTAAALVGTTLVAAPAATAQDGFDRSAFSAKKSARTPFAFRAVSYGSRIRGGDLPASSGTTSYQAIGCTNAVGVDKSNVIGSADLPELGLAKGVHTRVWTERRNGVHSSYSSHEIDKVVLHEDNFGELSLKGLSALSRAYFDGKKFRTSTSSAVQSLVYTPTDGPPQVLDAPKPSQPVIIPGLLEIRVGVVRSRVTDDQARAVSDVLDIRLVPTKTRVRIGHTAAQIARGVKRGLFSGLAAATQVRALNDLVISGPQPLTRMPCQGTKGKIRGKAIASVDLAPLIEVGAASTRQLGRQRAGKAEGFEEARVAAVDLGDGQLVIKGIVGRANVERTRNGFKADAKGTSILSAEVDGETYSFPELDGLSIPGLVEIETNVVTKLNSGIDVVAVRLTLLGGSGAVIDLGHARLSIVGSGLR